MKEKAVFFLTIFLIWCLVNCLFMLIETSIGSYGFRAWTPADLIVPVIFSVIAALSARFYRWTIYFTVLAWLAGIGLTIQQSNQALEKTLWAVTHVVLLHSNSLELWLGYGLGLTDMNFLPALTIAISILVFTTIAFMYFIRVLAKWIVNRLDIRDVYIFD